jgi:hypothetical protein
MAPHVSLQGIYSWAMSEFCVLTEAWLEMLVFYGCFWMLALLPALTCVFWGHAARAMLMKADIMLLDEPTNHLDVYNVKWLEDYLNGLSQVTSIIVSHDSGFLDNVCTDIIHYEDRKLRRYAVCPWR